MKMRTGRKRDSKCPINKRSGLIQVSPSVTHTTQQQHGNLAKGTQPCRVTSAWRELRHLSTQLVFMALHHDYGTGRFSRQPLVGCLLTELWPMV
jgi:hypothetical protein